jgi:isocitrate dehydrogenase kinase/phosphatase
MQPDDPHRGSGTSGGADAPLVREAARAVLGAFDRFSAEFHHCARSAQARFESGDWPGIQRDTTERLDLYSRVLAEVLAELRGILSSNLRDRDTWRRIRARYEEAVAAEVEAPLAETFFNSVTRRVFATVGIDPEIDFVAHEPCPMTDYEPVVDRFPAAGGLTHLFAALFASRPFVPGYADVFRDARDVAAIVAEKAAGRVRGLEVARPVFFRGKGAYIVGRLALDGRHLPLVIALINEGRGIEVDAVLLEEDEVSIVFSFARSYFMVDTNRPIELVSFLRTIMPRKPVSELFNAIGHNRHGKTEFYRALRRHMEHSDDRFEFARGVRGMVMIVFTLPSHDVVFKVIRDDFDYPKTTTREDVMARYRLVFRHDRAGRLVDAQEFEHLEFDAARFAPELLDELRREASVGVGVVGPKVDVRHVYTERRMVPLDIYLRESPPAAARAAVLDYGQVLRDLAAANIFPGDMLLKNFGVSRHGRVIFYDYDEISFLTDMTFRELPEARSDDEEMSAEPWYHVGERDVFPQEFLPFLGLTGELREAFLEHHGELLTPGFWRSMQDEHRAGRVPDILPYRPERRLRRGPPDRDRRGSAGRAPP